MAIRKTTIDNSVKCVRSTYSSKSEHACKANSLQTENSPRTPKRRLLHSTKNKTVNFLKRIKKFIKNITREGFRIIKRIRNYYF